MKYRKTNVRKWTDDIHISMSPEQKLIFDWLNTNPYTKMCGIHPISFATMARQVGIVEQNVRNAFEAMCKQFPNVIAFDEQTNEYFMPSWLIENAASKSPKVVKPVCDQIQEVQSEWLLRLLNERTSASRERVKKAVRDRLRSLSQSSKAQNQRGVSQIFENQSLAIPLGGRTKELKNLRTKEVEENQDFPYSIGFNSEENSPTKQPNKCTPPNSAPPPPFFFSDIKGLKSKVGPKHFGLLNDMAANPSVYQTLEGLISLGPSDEENAFMVLINWLEYKKERRQTYASVKSLKKLIEKTFSGFQYEELRKALDSSIANGYAGIFPKPDLSIRGESAKIKNINGARNQLVTANQLEHVYRELMAEGYE